MFTASRHSIRRVCAILLVVMLAGVAPSGASEADDAGLRSLIEFIQVPEGLVAGQPYKGGTVESVNHVLNFAVVVGATPKAVARQSAADDNVVDVRSDPILPMLQLTPDDPRFGSMYGPQQVRAPQAWDITTGSTSSAVCILDTGIRYTHEDLAGSRWLGGYDFVQNDADPWDDHFHGTHVAGTAAATMDNGLGVAGMGQVGIYAVKVLNRYGGGAWSWIANGITWCADNTMDHTVLSLSLGGSGAGAIVENAVNYAYETKGKLVVAASGNGGCTFCVIQPASFENVVAVGCTSRNDAESIAGLHRREPPICGFSSGGPEVEIMAPGQAIISTWNSRDNAYASISGTSMSTPHVSGAAALAWGQNPAWDVVTLRTMLQRTAVDAGAPGRDIHYGFGELDAYCLVMGLPACV